MRSKLRFFSGVFSCILLAVVLMAAAPFPADAAVGMKVLPGLGGLYKTNQPLELLVTVDNPGPAFAGTINVVQKGKHPERPDQPRVITNAHVPAHAAKKFHLVIPGELAAARPVVQLVSGKQVLAESRVEGVSVGGNNRLLLALGQDIAGGGLQSWLSTGFGAQANLKYLSAGELPANSLFLAAADAIMISPATVTALNEQQIRALKEWVYTGGTLVLFNGAGTEKGGVFADISPVLASGKKTVDGKLAGIGSSGPLVVAAGRQVAGRAAVVDNGVPVLARRNVGWGEVVYCAVAPSDLGASSRDFWSTILQDLMPTAEKNVTSQKGSLVEQAGQLVEPSAYIPQLSGPPVMVLVLLWLVYAAAVGPLLYFLLRRFDRRDWAWGVIPAGALLIAGGLYLLTPAVRMQGNLTQSISVMDILSPDLAVVRSGASIVPNQSGALNVRLAPGFYAVSGGPYGNTGPSPSLLYENGSRNTISFDKVPYKSMRQVYAYGLQRGRGSIDGQLYLDNKGIKGDLVNNTGLDLRDCQLIIGGRVIRTGDLPAKGTLHIDETVTGTGVAPGKGALITALLGGSGQRPGEPFYRERRMLQTSPVGEDAGRSAGIQFIGWHDGAPGLFQVTGKSSQSADYGLMLVEQTIALKLAPGRFYLPAGLITPHTGDISYVSNSTSQTGGKVIFGGQVPLTYNIADVLAGKHFQVTALDVQYVKDQYDLPVEIYNYREKKWEQLPDGGKRISGTGLSRYLSGDTVQLKVAGKSRGPDPVWPGLAVEGVIS